MKPAFVAMYLVIAEVTLLQISPSSFFELVRFCPYDMHCRRNEEDLAFTSCLCLLLSTFPLEEWFLITQLLKSTLVRSLLPIIKT